MNSIIAAGDLLSCTLTNIHMTQRTEPGASMNGSRIARLLAGRFRMVVVLPDEVKQCNDPTLTGAAPPA